MAGVGLGTAAMVVEKRRPVKGSGSFEWRNATPPRRQGLLKLAGKLYLISERASIVEERKMLWSVFMIWGYSGVPQVLNFRVT